MEENRPSWGSVLGSSASAPAGAFATAVPCGAGASARDSHVAPTSSSVPATHACAAPHRTRRDVSKVLTHKRGLMNYWTRILEVGGIYRTSALRSPAFLMPVGHGDMPTR